MAAERSLRFVPSPYMMGPRTDEKRLKPSHSTVCLQDHLKALMPKLRTLDKRDGYVCGNVSTAAIATCAIGHWSAYGYEVLVQWRAVESRVCSMCNTVMRAKLFRRSFDVALLFSGRFW